MFTFFHKPIGKFFAIIFVVASFLFFQNAASAVTDTYTSSGTWTAPAGVTSVAVEAWGGGGGGGGQNQNSDGGGGGGGGAYSKKNIITVIPGNNYTVTVGAGGTGVASSCGGTGGDSSFINTATILAKGGVGGCNSTGTPPAGGLGGASASGVGDTKYSGGQGEKGINNSTGLGGYGGSSAGTAANGYSGPQTYSTNIYPTASTPAGAGHGGNGGAASANGSTPTSGNGGGGGGSGEGTARLGGAGAVGKVVITYPMPDTTAPTPNPMTFASVPANDSSTQISMTSTTGSDATTPVNYLFTNTNTNCGTNAGTGGTSSSWQSTTPYSDSGLQANKCYGYTVTARDSAPTPNTGTASSISSTYTSANTPGTPTLSGATTNSLSLTNTENSNPASNPTTNFAVQVVTTSDGTWINKWVDATGNPSATAVWMSDATLDALVLHSLQSSTLYGVKVKARNNDTDETALSAEGQGTTSAPAPITTISNFVTGEPSNSTIAPVGSALVDSFGLQASSGTDTITGAIVTLATGTGSRVATVAITNNGDTVTYCSAAPSGDTATLTSCGIPVTTTNTQFKIKITAGAHNTMPTPPGGNYAVTGRVTAFTSTNAQVTSDTGSATITIDNLSPAGTTGASASAGNAQVQVNWANPADSDFQKVIIYCKTTSITETPTEGADPAVDVAACDGTARVKYSGSISPQIFTGLTNSTTYFFRIYARDTNGNFTDIASTQEVSATPSPAPTTTLGTSSDPAVNTIAPGASATDVNQFTLQTNTSTETITSVTVNLSTNSGVGLLAITNSSDTVLGSTASPITGSNVISVSSMSAVTSATTFKVRVTPLSHTAMPAVPGGAYSITAPVTAWTGSFAHTGSDTNINVLTVDNLSPTDVTSAIGSAGNAQVTTSWTNPIDSDFHSTVVLRRAGSAIATVPAEGSTYITGNAIGTATVACVVATPTATCIDSGLTNGTNYYYKIFSKDTHGNYGVGIALGAFTPSLSTFTITSTAGAHGTINPLGVTNVAQSSDQAYTITPDLGYDVATLVVDGSSQATSTTYMFGSVQTNHTIAITFVLVTPTYTITSTAGTNGTISPLGTTILLQGASQIYTITPTGGYVVDTLIVDSVSIATSTSHTFSSITTNHTIDATFILIPPPAGTFAVTATAGTNGTISPSGVTIVPQGNSQTYTITPNSGYDIATLTVDSVSVATSTSYTFTNVQTNHTIDSTFVALPAGATIAPDTGGSRATVIIFAGKAFPRGIISVIDKQLNTEKILGQQETTGEDGAFRISFIGVLQALHSFGILAKDSVGRISQSKFFFIDTISNDLVVKDILLPPTAELEERQVTRGSNAVIVGSANPGYTINLELDGILIKDMLAGQDGAYRFEIPTGALPFSAHTIRTKQTDPLGEKTSDFSTSRTLTVSRLVVVQADLNNDNKMDIRDWSIFLSLWGSKNTAGRDRIDFNKDRKIDISDFSIFIKTIRKK